MAASKLETDYLVVGGGASAMAFVDTLLDETDHRIVMVDRHEQPGGHWNDAYSFVRLHQPSAYYGVGSRELGRGVKYPSGPNAGGYDLASKAEILDYFDRVMQERFLPSGRVTWLPMSEYRRGPGGEHSVTSLLGESRIDVALRRKLVDATHVATEVAATHGPRYSVMSQVQLIPINGLPSLRRRHPCYTVVGAGKTGMDACLWLLANGVEPGRIRWIRPRDPWVMDRAGLQPFAENFERVMRSSINGFRAIAEATSPRNLFALLESYGVLMRFDSEVEPTAYRAAVLSRGELAQLQRIEDVVRLGHVTTIETNRIVLDDGTVEADPDTLYVDCSAAALHQPPPDLAVFEPGAVNILPTRQVQPVFSAALIGFVESLSVDDDEKNAMCQVVPYPTVPLDWLTMWLPTLVNTARWRQRPEVARWVSRSRLNALGAAQRGLDPADPRRRELRDVMNRTAIEAAARIPHLLATPDHGERERQAAGSALTGQHA
ncbi:NAD(P)-binding protein [Amycolatopsis sp. NPDC051903]|uniref:NAD(P)-binding protein n=1 Tax=Amycolatopsis sp. NPDC051903 TaxID=3363936 RepID=UPI0037B7480E